jgi:hypothetical protein
VHFLLPTLQRPQALKAPQVQTPPGLRRLHLSSRLGPQMLSALPHSRTSFCQFLLTFLFTASFPSA